MRNKPAKIFLGGLDAMSALWLMRILDVNSFENFLALRRSSA
jgi:hypothetical protein